MNIKNITTTFIILALIFAQATTLFAQSVGINHDGSEPDSRAILDVKSSDKGVLLPRLNDTERDELFRDVPFGMMIFNTTDSALQIFMDTAWYSFDLGNPEVAPKPLTDADGNIYATVQIGTQTWMAENLKTTKYNDGSPIELVTDNTSWDQSTSGAYCWYNNDEATYADTYGAIYNWHAVGTGNLCPDGWHVSSDADWTTLKNYVMADGHNGNEGAALKSASDWLYDGNGTNDYGFTALPGGFRYSGYFSSAGEFGYWWTSSADDASSAWSRDIESSSSTLNRYSYEKQSGFSVRCMKD